MPRSALVTATALAPSPAGGGGMVMAARAQTSVQRRRRGYFWQEPIALAIISDLGSALSESHLDPSASSLSRQITRQ